MYRVSDFRFVPAFRCLFRHYSRVKSTLMPDVEKGKQAAAMTAVDEWLKDNQIVGIGSGTTVVYAVKRIYELVSKENWKIKCVPSSYQALQLIMSAKLPLTTLDENPVLDVTFDGVDEMTPDFNSIKGGGGCLLQEKIVGYNAKSFVVIADESKRASYLGEKWKRGLPIEVVPMASTTVKNEIERRFGGVAKLRMAVSKMGPVVTDNGNFLLDWQFDADPSINWRQMDIDLHLIPGVVDTGLFLGLAVRAYFGKADGSVEKWTK
uniref:ribose-5-phosphate isomerase n=2 Tax=Schistocephalus solidus TaxID=70667 RepID=A0A0V0J3X7_SCHSO